MAEALFDHGLVTAATAARAPMLDTLTYDEESGGLRRWAGQQWVAHPVGKAKLAEFRELLALRDTTTALIGAHAAEIPVGQRDQLRGELNLMDFSSRPHGVFHVRRSAVRALWHTQGLRSGRLPGGASRGVGRSAGSARRPSRRRPVLSRAGHRLRQRARAGRSVLGEAR